MRVLTLGLAAVLAVGLPVFAATVFHRTTAASSRTAEALLEARDGVETRRPIAGLNLLSLGGSDSVSVQITGVERSVAKLEPAELCRVQLVGGDQLSGRVSGGEEETLVMRLAGVRLPVVIDRLESLLWPERIPTGTTQELSPSPEGDRLYRVSGSALDVIDGAVVAFTNDGVEFDGVLGQRVFPWGEVAGLFLEVLSDEGASEQSGGIPVVSDLVGGTRLRGSFRALRETGLELILSGDMRIVIPIEQVLEVALDDGSLRFLSDLIPSAEPAVGSPFDDGGMTWPHRVDRSCNGKPLTVDGHVWHRGLGVHAPSELVYALDGRAATLFGAVAIDDSVLLGPKLAHGSARFSIVGDGKSLWQSEAVRGGDGHTAFGPLDVSGVRELRLVVDPLGDFMGDRANWLRVRLYQ